VCLYVCGYVQDELFNPLTDSNQIWCGDYSELGGKHRLHKNSFSLTPLGDFNQIKQFNN
jgi:hypothetical protein